jgi:hypothetical protein
MPSQRSNPHTHAPAIKLNPMEYPNKYVQGSPSEVVNVIRPASSPVAAELKYQRLGLNQALTNPPIAGALIGERNSHAQLKSPELCGWVALRNSAVIANHIRRAIAPMKIALIVVSRFLFRRCFLG